MALTTEQIEELHEKTLQRRYRGAGLYLDDVNTLVEWALAKGGGHLSSILFYAISIAYDFGAKKGMAYEKARIRKQRKKDSFSCGIIPTTREAFKELSQIEQMQFARKYPEEYRELYSVREEA